jgi:ABC-type antimicrobial peptide transport system permease subunit
MSVIINQAAADFMGMKDPIGQKIIYNKDPHEIIGVTANVVMDSPYQPVEPLVMIFDPSWSSTITVRLNEAENLKASIDQVEQVFKKLNPAYPFEFRFADSDFQAKFSSINLVSKLSFIFAALAIAITCFGLLGLAAFTAEQRTKEIGIRKVLGATVSSIVILITSDFSKLIFVAFLIASPIGWWVITNFLERYPYRVGISGWILLAAGSISLILALLIVSTQALRAAISNPTDSLRSE